MTSPDLSLVETSALLDELFSRFEHCLFEGARSPKAETSAILWRYHGDRMICEGMASHAALRIGLDRIDSASNGDDDT